MNYQVVFFAGTFDGLHAGHRAILTRAFEEGERVTIGLTSDAFVRMYKSDQSDQSDQFTNENSLKFRRYEERKKELTRWLKKQHFLERATIIPIDDPYEPAASMPDLDALIVTKENRKTGERINALRYALGVSPLVLIEVPMVEAEDGNPISSTRMRNGEIDREGNLVMPEFMRIILGKPLGTVLEGAAITASIARSLKHAIITVGDIATKTILDAGITSTLAIIDGMVGRKPFHGALDLLQPRRVRPFEAGTVKSGPGYISGEAMEAIRTMLNSPHPPLILRGGEGGVTVRHVLIIDGEEDLLVLPAILYAPIGAVLYYGQPGEGLVEVVVTEGKKQQALALLGKFT